MTQKESKYIGKAMFAMCLASMAADLIEEVHEDNPKWFIRLGLGKLAKRFAQGVRTQITPILSEKTDVFDQALGIEEVIRKPWAEILSKINEAIETGKEVEL